MVPVAVPAFLRLADGKVLGTTDRGEARGRAAGRALPSSARATAPWPGRVTTTAVTGAEGAECAGAPRTARQQAAATRWPGGRRGAGAADRHRRRDPRPRRDAGPGPAAAGRAAVRRRAARRRTRRRVRRRRAPTRTPPPTRPAPRRTGRPPAYRAGRPPASGPAAPRCACGSRSSRCWCCSSIVGRARHRDPDHPGPDSGGGGREGPHAAPWTCPPSAASSATGTASRWPRPSTPATSRRTRRWSPTRPPAGEQLAAVLGGDAAGYTERLTGQRRFIYIAKNVTPETWDKVAALRIPGRLQRADDDPHLPRRATSRRTSWASSGRTAPAWAAWSTASTPSSPGPPARWSTSAPRAGRRSRRRGSRAPPAVPGLGRAAHHRPGRAVEGPAGDRGGRSAAPGRTAARSW